MIYAYIIYLRAYQKERKLDQKTHEIVFGNPWPENEAPRGMHLLPCKGTDGIKRQAWLIKGGRRKKKINRQTDFRVIEKRVGREREKEKEGNRG